MKHFVLIVIGIVLFVSGCFLLNGSLQRGNSRVLLIKDSPNYYGKGAKDEPSGTLGTFPYHKGDMINTIGYFSGGVDLSCFLISANHAEVYIERADVLTADDQLYQRLGSKFRLTIPEDYNAWSRAMDYVKNQTHLLPEIANDNLIKSKSTRDTTAINYIVTRLPERAHVEYEIVCQSKRKDFNPNSEASQVAFYMVTGRIYQHQ